MPRRNSGPPRLWRLLRIRDRIVFDCLGLRVGTQAGASRLFGHLLAEVARRSVDSFVVLTNKVSAAYFERLFTPARVIRLPVSGRSRARRLLFQLLFYPLLLLLSRPKLFITTSMMPMWGYGCRRLAFIFDLLPFHHPDNFGRFELAVKRFLITTCARTADGIVTISKWSAGDIRQKLGSTLRGQVHVVEGAAGGLHTMHVSEASQRRTLRQLGLEGRPFILAVLGGRPYKNPHRLIQGFRQRVAQGNLDMALVIVGYASHLLQDAAHRDIIVPGYISDEALASLYRHARALVFPTLFEGFGLPVLEAQAFGVPVVCSDLPVLHEVAGAAAVFVDPYSAESIADGIWNVLRDSGLRAQLTELGFMNALRYSRENAAEQFLAACRLEIANVRPCSRA